MDWSVIGIIFSLAFIVVLALRGWHIIIIAPLAVVIVSIFSDMNIMQTMTGPYMKGFVNYAGRFYLIFLAGSVFGKFMEDGQAARSIAEGILRVTGKENPLRMMLAVALVALCLTYGGVSLFVVIFAVIPIARPLFKELDLPWHLFMAAIHLRGGLAVDDHASGHSPDTEYHAHKIHGIFTHLGSTGRLVRSVYCRHF